MTAAYVKQTGVYGLFSASGAKVKVAGVYVGAVGAKVKVAGTYVAIGVAPANTVTPTLAGDAALGVTLTCTPGIWTGTPTPTITHHWEADGLDIPGEIGLTYVTQPEDAGKTVRCVERATNAVASLVQPTNSILMPSTGFSNGFDNGFH